MRESEHDRPVPREAFQATRWSLVLAASSDSTSIGAPALEKLCATYWYPLYAYARRAGQSPEDAQDLTQGFFARLLQNGFLAKADPGRGKFRTFLLSSFKHFIHHEWQRAHAQKRGGSASVLPLDAFGAEQRYGVEPTDRETPESLYERRWALTVLEIVLGRLRLEQAAEGRTRTFELLKPYLTGDAGAPPMSVVAEKLGLSEGAIAQSAHRLRRRYRELLRAEIAETVADSASVDEEVRNLAKALRRR